MNRFIQISGNIYLTDFLDVFIMALVIYSLFLFLRKTKSYLGFLGLGITTALYFLAREFNLYLTFLTLKYFVGVAVIIFVILFQNEIKKYLEFIGFIGTRRLKVGKMTPKSPTTSEIIQACVKMARAKIGALIVIQGEDNLDALVDGGIELDGVISEDILLSIFDPSSEGHDGALIIINNRIAKFGGHLPLSSNFKEIGKHGTRHSAALGLAENSDALCIVVSEEKGHISIAKNSKLKKLDKSIDLEKELSKYIKTTFLPAKESLLKSLVSTNFGLKLGALICASIVWYFTAYQAGIIEKTYTIAIKPTEIPKNVVIEDYSPKEIKLTVTGRGDHLFSTITADDFKIDITANSLQNGLNKKNVAVKDIVLPANVSLSKIEPETILLTATKYKLEKIPIAAKITGEVSDKTEFKGVIVNPESIEVWIPEESTAPKEIATELIDIASVTESVIIPVNILLPENILIAGTEPPVNVAINVKGE